MKELNNATIEKPIKTSIAFKIFLSIFAFSLVIIALIAVGTQFILPSYYLQQQVSVFDEAEANIRLAYHENDFSRVISEMDNLRDRLNGQVYYYTDTASMGRGRGNAYGTMMNENNEKFRPDGDVTVYTYTNKVGLSIHVIGVKINGEYLVYEGSIQSIDHAMTTLKHFLFLLLAIVLGLALIIAYFLSRQIASPIRALNQLAEEMKSRRVETRRVVKADDELGDLNQTLNELYEELRGTIYQLNAELQKERQAENLKKRFLAQATHELKTPIAVIKGYAEILYDGLYQNEEERDRFLKNIYDESEAVSTLILEVLDYTKLETGNDQLHYTDLPVKETISDLLERYRDYIEKESLIFKSKIQVKNDFVKKVDQRRFEQVYKNLISNAAEHAASLVSVEVSQLNDRLKIAVYNDGSSVLDEDLPFIFESFYKKKGKVKGTGLGLAIVKEIILAHGGDYWVENKEDGVEFVVIF